MGCSATIVSPINVLSIPTVKREKVLVTPSELRSGDVAVFQLFIKSRERNRIHVGLLRLVTEYGLLNMWGEKLSYEKLSYEKLTSGFKITLNSANWFEAAKPGEENKLFSAAELNNGDIVYCLSNTPPDLTTLRIVSSLGIFDLNGKYTSDRNDSGAYVLYRKLPKDFSITLEVA